MATTTAINAGIYVRISQDAEDEGLGVARQRQDCERLAEGLGWNVVEVYEDNDISASTGKPRPAYQRMTRDIEAGAIRGVIVWDVDRLTRTPRELEDVIDWANKLGLDLANVGGEIDLSTPQGKMTARIKGAVSRHEVEQASRRIRRKNLELAEQGWHHGPRPFGWDVRPDKTLSINEAEASVVRESAMRTLEGDTLWGIVRELNARGIPTIKGNRWSTAGLRSILRRWRNCGVRTHHGKEMGKGLWEPLYDRETHERLLALLDDPARRTDPNWAPNRGTEVKYLLSGLMHCAGCGSKLAGAKARDYMVTVKLASGPVKRPRHFPARYDCRQDGCQSVMRRMDELDPFVSEVVVQFLEREGVHAGGGEEESAREAREEVEGLEAKLSLISDQFADDIITPDQFQRLTSKLRPRLEEAKRNLVRVTPTSGPLSDVSGPSARDTWENANIEQRREILKALIGFGMKITVGKTGRRRDEEYDYSAIDISWHDGRDAP